MTRLENKGEWIEVSDNYGHSSYFCSRCGTQEGKPSGLCPNCGAEMDNYERKKKYKNPKFQVIVCGQGHPFYYQYSTLIGALVGYAKHYLNKNKYGTMNCSLKQIF